MLAGLLLEREDEAAVLAVGRGVLLGADAALAVAAPLPPAREARGAEGEREERAGDEPDHVPVDRLGRRRHAGVRGGGRRRGEGGVDVWVWWWHRDVESDVLRV